MYVYYMKQVIKPLVLNVWLPNSPILGLHWGAALRHSHIGGADLGARGDRTTRDGLAER